jgi:hypothetical protein
VATTRRKAVSKKIKANQINLQKAVQVLFNALVLLNLVTDVKEGQAIQAEGVTSTRQNHENNFTIDKLLQ